MISQKLPGIAGAALKVMKANNPLGIELVTETRDDFRAIVSPDDARWILSQMHQRQRHVSAPEVAHYVRLIQMGQFVPYMQPGIMFDRRGRAVNAQHRLRAQVSCEATLEWMIRVGCSDEEIAATDQTRKRQAHQSFNLTHDGNPVTGREEAAIRVLSALLRSTDTLNTQHSKMAVEDLLELRSKYGDDVAWALGMLRKNCGPASMAGAFAFAKPCAPEVVERFAEEYTDARLILGRVTHEKNSPPAVLARWMNQVRGGAGGQFMVTVVNKTLSALKARIEGRTLAKVYGDDEYAKPVRYFVGERARLNLNK